MRKWTVSLLCILLLCGSVSCSLAGPVACPEAHLVLTVPDSWRNVPLSSADDPDLYLLLEGDGISLSVYIADAGGLLPGAFQVFTGDETDSGTLTVQGVEISYVAGENSDGAYWIYTWTDRRSQVQLYFLVTGNRQAARSSMNEIIHSLRFE